jgi:hypothetical protein
MAAGPSVNISILDMLPVILTLVVDVAFNDHWHSFSGSSAKGGSAVPIVNEPSEML